jgi:alpha/beta superfamily hydrolase
MRTDVIKPALYGALGGAIALAIIGFSWGGWVTNISAERTAKTRSEAAVVAALAPICASQFRQAPDAAAQQAVLVTKNFWEQKKLVETGGWAKMPGSTEVPSGLAQACADLIVNLKL